MVAKLGWSLLKFLLVALKLGILLRVVLVKQNGRSSNLIQSNLLRTKYPNDQITVFSKAVACLIDRYFNILTWTEFLNHESVIILECCKENEYEILK